MRSPATHRWVAAPTRLAAFLCGALIVAGCSTPDAPAPTVASSTPKPSASPAPVVRFKVPAKMNGIPRATDGLWLDDPKSTESFLKRMVFNPKGGSVAAAYVDPGKYSDTIQLSAASGLVVAPADTLRLMTGNRSIDLENVRPADPGTPGGVGTCGVSDKIASPAVTTVCDWAEPGSVGSVTIYSSKDRRDTFADIRAALQP